MWLSVAVLHDSMRQSLVDFISLSSRTILLA